MAFVSRYQSDHAISNRSEVFERAYLDAKEELSLYEDFEGYLGDGLEYETW